MLSNRVYDVLIVGAGPVGLATAIALRQRGINNILVIEQARSFRQVGQGIDILPNGLKALKCIDIQAYDRVKQTGLELVKLANNNNPGDKKTKKRAWNNKNLQGKMIPSIPLDFEYWLNHYGEGRVSLSWYGLQTTLRNLLPPEIVRVNHRCIDFTKGNGYLEVTCVSNEREIVNNPFAHWERQNLGQGKSNSTDKLETEGSDGKKLRAKLVSLSTSEGLFHRPYYIHPADISIPDSKPIWSNGRVVLVGDAAHGMPPFAAQGVNQGFEDAALIATLITKIINSHALDDEKIIANEFIKYEQIRRPFMSKIQSATMESHNWSQAQWNDFGNMVYGRDLVNTITQQIKSLK